MREAWGEKRIMSTARVTSVEAIRDFRGSYLVYCDEAKQSLETADAEARRMKDWISAQAQYWKKEIRACEERLNQAKSALFRKELQKTAAGRPPDVIEEKKAVAKAKEALEHAKQKLANCKRWRSSTTGRSENTKARRGSWRRR